LKTLIFFEMFFYTPDINRLQYALNEEESEHALRSLRLKEGDEISLTDGSGGLYRARIDKIQRKTCLVSVLEHRAEYGKRPYRIHIGIAPTKNIARFEWFVEKATEMGIDEITPLLVERSERKHLSIARLQRIMIAAMKQSQKAYLPKINEMTNLEQWLETQTCTCKYIAHCGAGSRQSLKTAYQPQQDVAIAIGPEGDFSVQEVAKALACGFAAISLGDSRLRTETAGIAACCGVHLLSAV